MKFLKIKPSFFLIALFSFVFLGVSAQFTYAGGGNYGLKSPMGGSSVQGKSTQVVVQTWDFSSGSPAHPTGEKFKIVAHESLPGASCGMTQDTADGEGLIKATCQANTTGRFVFHVEALTKTDLGNSPEFSLTFTDSPTPSSAAAAEPENQNQDSGGFKIPFTSTADGPCESGVQTLAYVYPNECKRGDHLEGYLQCKNGFVVKITQASCTSQLNHSWDDAMNAICGHWACKAEHVPFIDSKGVRMEVVGASNPSPSPVASPSPSVKPAVDEQKVAEEATDSADVVEPESFIKPSDNQESYDQNDLLEREIASKKALSYLMITAVGILSILGIAVLAAAVSFYKLKRKKITEDEDDADDEQAEIEDSVEVESKAGKK